MTDADGSQPIWKNKAVQRAIDAAGIALWSWNMDTDDFEMDPQGYKLWDVNPGEAMSFELLSEKIHPADRDRVRAAFSATRSIVGQYEIDFRTLVGKDVRWISARGRGDDEDIQNRVMACVFRRDRAQAGRGMQRTAGRRDEPPGEEPAHCCFGSCADHLPVLVLDQGHGRAVVAAADGFGTGA